MARTMGVEQAYTMVEALYKQATGNQPIAVVDTATFTTVAQSTLKVGYNQVMDALAEVMNGLTVTERPYSAKFKMVYNNEESFGNHRMKISYIDNANAVTNAAWGLQDGQTLGQHTVKLPKAFEGNFYGQNTIEAFITIPRNQLRTAFGSPADMARFFSGLMQSIENQLEQQKEALCRSTLLNFMGGKNWADSAGEDNGHQIAGTHVIHLFTEYKAKFGKKHATLDALRAVPADYAQFIKFVYARMDDLVAQMGNRGEDFHINPTGAKDGGVINRHSDPADLRCYICREYLTEIETQVLTGVWNREYLKDIPHEDVLYWQSSKTPTQIKVTPSCMKKDGTVSECATQNMDNVFGVIYDKDALGVGITDTFTGETPLDVEKEAKNKYWKLDARTWNDFTENGLVLKFD